MTTSPTESSEAPDIDPSFDRWLAKSPADRERWPDNLTDTELKEMAALTRHIFHLDVGTLQLARAMTALLRFTDSVKTELNAQRMNGDAIMQARMDIGNATGIDGAFFDDVVNRLLDRLDRAETENARLRLQQSAHGARITELLEANNREVERRREAEHRVEHMLAVMELAANWGMGSKNYDGGIAAGLRQWLLNGAIGPITDPHVCNLIRLFAPETASQVIGIRKPDHADKEDSSC